MAVIISDSSNSSYDGKLATSNGFYVVEASNLTVSNNTNLQLTTTARTISVTFANAGNCQGIVLALEITSETESNSVTVTLQENTGSWVNRASVTYAISQITPAASGYRKGCYFVPFTGGTFPYAVDTASGKWRFSIAASGSSYIYLMTSDGTNPIYATWCDNKASFSNNDTLIIKDQLVINQSATFNGAYVCRNLDASLANVALLLWENPPSASYTLTLNNSIVLCAYGGFRMGTSDSPIPATYPAYIESQASTAIKGLQRGDMMSYHGKYSIFLYSEYPSVMRTTLAADANSGQKTIITTDETGWSSGDVIAIGKWARTTGSQLFTIDTISSTTITLTANLDRKRFSGGSVIKLGGGGFGIYFQKDTNVVASITLDVNFQIRGVCFKRTSMGQLNHYYAPTKAEANYTVSEPFIEYCSFSVQTISYPGIFINGVIPINGMRIEKCNSAMGVLFSFTSLVLSNWRSGTLKVYDCRGVDNAHGSSGYLGSRTDANSFIDFRDNILENGYWLPALQLMGINAIFKNNKIWGFYSNNYGALYIGSLINSIDISGNTIDDCTIGVEIGPYSMINTKFSNFTFGSSSSNGTDIYLQPFAYLDLLFDTPTGISTLNISNIIYSIPGSKLGFINYNNTTGDHRNYLTYGHIVSTGDGLTDTTVHTSGTGKFAIRFESSSSTNPLTWDFTVPTGNIQGKTMTVTVWCKINSVNYYSGTYQLPRLMVDYDNGTTVYCQASETTDWQQLFVTFTPTTTYGQITVTLSTMTDQTGSSAYVYWDDMSLLYPANHTLDLGGMDNWANALPVTPPIAIPLSAYSVSNAVWEELTSSHTTDNTMGKKLGTTLKNPKLIIDGTIII